MVKLHFVMSHWAADTSANEMVSVVQAAQARSRRSLMAVLHDTAPKSGDTAHSRVGHGQKTCRYKHAKIAKKWWRVVRHWLMVDGIPDMIDT